MNGFKACLLFLAASSQAMPQYSPQPQLPQTGRRPGNDGIAPLTLVPEDGCRIEYVTVHTIEENENEEEVCTPYTDIECKTNRRLKCTPYQDKECKWVPQEKCETKFEDVCEDLVRQVPETYTEDVCETSNVITCQKHWKIYPNGDKKWEENPEACQTLPETRCRPELKTRTKPEPYTECKQVPRQHCWTDKVEQCIKVTKQECVYVPEEVCKNVEKKKCEIIHTKTPQSKATKKAVRVCNNNLDSATNNSEVGDEDFEIIQSTRKENKVDFEKDSEKEKFTWSD